MRLRVDFYLIVVWLCAFSPLLGGCGSNANSNPPAVSSATDLGVPGSKNWSELTVGIITDARYSTCDSPYTMTIKNDGSFTTGPCHVNNDKDKGISGNLTPEEFSKLNDALQPLLTEDLHHQFCTGQGNRFDLIKMTLGLPGGTNTVIEEINWVDSCFHGDSQNVQFVAIIASSVVSRYYPRGN